MNWRQDDATARAAATFPLPLRSVVPAQQFPGYNFNPANWGHRVQALPRWPVARPLRSSPENIIALFQQRAFLEALAMVVSWGKMWRQPQAVYGQPLAVIEQALGQCADSIPQTGSIQCSWDILTGNSPNQLAWSAVLASKTLSFLCRALGFDQQPPVAIDGAVIRQRVWPAFVNGVPAGQRPLDWRDDSFDDRYLDLGRPEAVDHHTAGGNCLL